MFISTIGRSGSQFDGGDNLWSLTRCLLYLLEDVSSPATTPSHYPSLNQLLCTNIHVPSLPKVSSLPLLHISRWLALLLSPLLPTAAEQPAGLLSNKAAALQVAKCQATASTMHVAHLSFAVELRCMVY